MYKEEYNVDVNWVMCFPKVVIDYIDTSLKEFSWSLRWILIY